MKKIHVHENDPVQLEKTDIDSAVDILQKNADLPFKVDGLSLIFSPYTIGQIQLKDTLIEIRPRNPAFTLENFFEMILFTNSEKFESDIFSSTYEQDASFGIRSLATHFCDVCDKLLRMGITGHMISRSESSMTVNGQIILEKFHKAKIPLEGIDVVEGQYTINVLPNQVIKSALNKLLLAESDKRTSSRIISVLREFDSIDDYTGSYEVAENSIQKFFSANGYYPIALEYAMRILRDIKISCRNGSIEWSAFLQNSNSVFEQYVRKILERGLKEHIEKFQEAKKYAKIHFGLDNIVKTFSPDILIGYDRGTGSCMAVLDVKNKAFSPVELKSGETPSPADIYQLAFYCKRLDTSIGGLIYPSSEEIEPIEVSIEDEKNLTFLLVSVNMKDDIRSRHIKLVDRVRKQILGRI